MLLLSEGYLRWYTQLWFFGILLVMINPVYTGRRKSSWNNSLLDQRMPFLKVLLNTQNKGPMKNWASWSRSCILREVERFCDLMKNQRAVISTYLYGHSQTGQSQHLRHCYSRHREVVRVALQHRAYPLWRKV